MQQQPTKPAMRIEISREQKFVRLLHHNGAEDGEWRQIHIEWTDSDAHTEWRAKQLRATYGGTIVNLDEDGKS